MAVRPSWEGHLRLSLVTCSVALYPATSEAETVRFNLINPATGNRIKMKTVDAGTGEDVSRGDLVKGYAIAKNEYVLLDKEDFESVKLESTRILDIEKFVPRESIDRLYGTCPITSCRAARPVSKLSRSFGRRCKRRARWRSGAW
jgi:DNA end-binding protein Ku